MKKLILLLCIAIFFLAPLHGELYKATTVRAAPGRLLDLIEFFKSQQKSYRKAGEEPPLLMRHSQGDQWDLLLLYPIGSFQSHYSAESVGRRQAASDMMGKPEELRQRFSEMLAWHQDIFVDGPPLSQVRKAFEGAGFFHVEMFRALPGKHQQLRQQRGMENVYLEHLGRPQNLMFSHVEGAAWDVFTIGCYRDLKHFAESADIPEERENEAARKAGFESAAHIGPYLRTLISEHHDTLAVAVR